MAIVSTSTAPAGVSGPQNVYTSQMQSPISEEDESTETASEGAEPLTPVTDSVPHSFHHHDPTIDQVASLHKPTLEISKALHHASPPTEPPPYPPPPPPISSEQTPFDRMQNGDGGNKGNREATAFGLHPILPVSPFTPAEAPDSGSTAPSAPATENSTSPITSLSDFPQPPAQLRAGESSKNNQTATETPKKELPSLFDVPPNFRKTSTSRGRSPSQKQILDPNNGGTNITQTPRNSSPEKPLPKPPRTPTAPVSSEQPKRTIVKRANTFLSKLKRTPSNKHEDAMLAAYQPPVPQFDASKPVSSTNRRPSIPISQSARHTPSTSTSHTPPSPSSQTSSLSEEREEDNRLKKITTTGGHNQSKSQSGISEIGGTGPRIAWDRTPNSGSFQRRPSPETMRKRSASTDQLPRINIRKPNQPVDSDEPMPAQLFPTFSKHANEGAGLKARRLSTSLPDEFHVDYCELNNEFKPSKLFARRGKTIGKGATAEVTIMARKDSKDLLVAVKEFRGKEKDENETEYVKKVKSEYTIAKSLHHPNIVETIRLCTHSGRWNHVMEYCDLGDLYSLVEKGLFKGGDAAHYKQDDKLCFFKQLLRGVDYLHSHGIAHRDIKLENLLLTHDGFIKITDFGVSEVFSGEHPGLRAAGGECGKNMGTVRKCSPGICGSLPYIAPEVLEKKGDYDPRGLDIWSCAIVYITMNYGGPPWHAAKLEQENYKRFINGWNKWSVDHPDGEIVNEQGGWPLCGNLFAFIEPPPLRRMLLKMLNPTPEKRVSIRDALTKSFVKGIQCCTPDGTDTDDSCCGIDASKGTVKSKAKAVVLPKHNHLPPKEHKTPKALQHRFDMGHGWN